MPVVDLHCGRRRPRIDSGVRRPLAIRLLTLVVALLGSLPASVLAVTHGLVHAHLAHEHRHEHGVDAPAPAERHSPTLSFDDATDGDHAHGHLILQALPGARQLGRLDVATVDAVALPASASIEPGVVVVHAPARADRALLARPDPGGGPATKPRAPPVG